MIASMTSGPRGWTLTLKDETMKTSRSTTVAYANGESFTEAEWIQEDPPLADVSSYNSSYPLLSPVAFKDSA